MSGNIDREKNATLKIIVRASDEGSNPQSSTADFWIVVRDVNDNPPKFNDTVYFVELEENADNDTVVIVVTATDIDDHGKIVYTLQGDTEDWFKINDSVSVSSSNNQYGYYYETESCMGAWSSRFDPWVSRYQVIKVLCIKPGIKLLKSSRFCSEVYITGNHFVFNFCAAGLRALNLA